MLIVLTIIISILFIKYLPLKQIKPLNYNADSEFSISNKFRPSKLLYAGLVIGISSTFILIAARSLFVLDIPSSLFALTLAPAIPCGIVPLMLESKSWSYE
ncbi:hypothetical protein BGK46_06180 [Salinivibrio sp. SS2]|nr:hypothetical protein BGK46_06180 [Salinivibrio sp. DV]